MIEWEMIITGNCEKIEDIPAQAHIVAIDDISCYGRCEGCAKPILEGDRYSADEDGTILCEACTDACLD